MKRLKRFLGHLAYLLLLLPLLVIVCGFTYCSLAAETLEQYGVLYTQRTEDLSTGDIREEEYAYDTGYTQVTCTYTVNGTVTDTETWAIGKDDPLLTDTYEILPHPTATAANAEREENGSHVVIRYFDANGNPEGWSELTYNSFHRLSQQQDFAANGTPLRLTTRTYFTHTVSAFGETEAAS